MDEKLRLLGRMRLHKGHKVYKCNTKTKELTEVFIDPEYSGNLMREENMFYLTALNVKNAKRKVKKWLDIEVKFKNE